MTGQRYRQAHGNKQVTGRKRERGKKNVEGAPECLPQTQTAGAGSLGPGAGHERASPESSVQGDALCLMLTEVHPGHAVVDHLVAQLTWWGG